MATEIIYLTPQTRELILVTQGPFKAETTKDLNNKINRGLWKPDPPVILTPMPDCYTGRYKHHLYNGNHRDSDSIKWGVPLNGFVAHFLDDIPKSEVPNGHIKLTPNYMLRLGLINLICTIYGAEPKNRTLQGLVLELQELEQMLSHEQLVSYFR